MFRLLLLFLSDRIGELNSARLPPTRAGICLRKIFLTCCKRSCQIPVLFFYCCSKLAELLPQLMYSTRRGGGWICTNDLQSFMKFVLLLGILCPRRLIGIYPALGSDGNAEIMSDLLTTASKWLSPRIFTLKNVVSIVSVAVSH